MKIDPFIDTAPYSLKNMETENITCSGYFEFLLLLFKV